MTIAGFGVGEGVEEGEDVFLELGGVGFEVGYGEVLEVLTLFGILP